VTQRSETAGKLAVAAGPRLGELHARARAFSALKQRLEAVLPAAEASHITGIVQRDSIIVILVDSSAWCSRLRYRTASLRERLSAIIGQEVREIRVRVVPRGARR